jgi:hypothetical protein
MSDSSLRRLILKSIAAALPAAPDLSLPVPDESVGFVRTSMCSALQDLQAAGAIGNWTLQEVTVDAVEVRVASAQLLQFEVLRFPMANILELALVSDVMDS